MAHFAKLFNVKDTQVLVTVTQSSEGDPSLRVQTEVKGAEFAHSFCFKDDSSGWDKANEGLEMFSQEMAEGFYADVSGRFGEFVGEALTSSPT